MTQYEPLTDAVGVLHTQIVKRRWVTGCDGIPLGRDEGARPVKCLVWNPADVYGKPEELRRILVNTMAEKTIAPS